MVTKISKNAFRNLLDECDLSSKLTQSGNFIVSLEADNDFGHNVDIMFFINEETGRLDSLGVADSDFNISNDELAHAYVICNEWNRNYITQAYVADNSFWVSYSIIIDEPVSESFIKENFIRISTSVFWQFFCSLVK